MRTVAPEIFADEFFGTQLDNFHRVLWMGLILTIADDQGRMLSNAALIRGKVFPYDDLSLEEIETALNTFIHLGRLISYSSGVNDSKRNLLQMLNWWKYQRSASWMGPSKFPAPEGWMDRVRCHTADNKIVILNWDRPGGFTNELPSPLLTPLPSPLPRREDEDDIKRDSKRKREGAALSPKLAIYRQVTRSLPTKPQMEFVEKFMLENQIGEKALSAAWELWNAKGYNPRNVKGVLEYAARRLSVQSDEIKGCDKLSAVASHTFDANAKQLQEAMNGRP